ncbi:MAG: carboxylating nicotinate-nucleotide diphosphorylase [Planctomycetes bacterium]|nr:carboxylating nicotinate-nucleotide diphosphorylase [Planctomycetota bacterium]
MRSSRGAPERAATGAGSLPAPRRGLPEPLAREVIDGFARPALEEDRGGGDLTSTTAVPEKARARARLLAKSSGVLAGIGVFARVFELADPRVKVAIAKEDGARFQKGDVLATVEGSARALLTAERTALNFVQRMSGTATLTAKYVELARAGGGERVRVLDTRKTTPNLRKLEKYAVRCGGGENHRFGLYDEVMVKENHIELAGKPIVDVLRDLRRAVGARVRITSEARDEKEARAGVEGGADVILLDNMSVAELARLCPLLREQARALGCQVELEASGGIDLSTTQAIAATGVDRLSVGALTHSAPAMDLSLELEPLA